MRTLIIGLLTLLVALIVLCLASVCSAQSVLNGCGPAGDATKAEQKLLNPLKNRFVIPTAVNEKITLDALLAPGEDSTRFLSGDAATIIGFVVKEKLGGVESCNCHSTDPRYMDRHLYIGKTKNAALKDCVIVELTPRFYEAHPDWMYVHQFEGKIVRITGDLFYDKEHEPNAEHIHPGNKRNWRATCWELHPVTNIEIIE